MARYGGENNRRERLIKVRDMEREKKKAINKKKTKKETNKKDKIIFIFPTKYFETLICSTV